MEREAGGGGYRGRGKGGGDKGGRGGARGSAAREGAGRGGVRGPPWHGATQAWSEQQQPPRPRHPQPHVGVGGGGPPGSQWVGPTFEGSSWASKVGGGSGSGNGSGSGSGSGSSSGSSGGRVVRGQGDHKWVEVGHTAPSIPSQPQPPPPPVADPVIEKLKLKEISEDSDKILPVKRPDKGGVLAVRTVGLRANHFPVKFNPNTIIMHYVVDVQPAVPPKNGRPVRISKSVLSVIRNKLSSDDPEQFPLSKTVYDDRKNTFSVVPLPTGKIDVEVHEGEDMKGGSYVVTINLVNQFEFGKLKDYLNGQPLSVPRYVLQGMALVMKENPSRHMIPFGRRFFPREPREGDDLGWGITASRGFQPSLKSTSQGLALCVNYTVLAFRKKMSVLDFLWEHIPNFDIKNFRRFRRDVEDALGGLKVTVTHWKTNQKHIIRGLTRENTQEFSFIQEDPECQNPPRHVRIFDYFREKYGKDIMYKDIPCLDLGKANKENSVPMEFCVLVEGQRYPKEHLDRNAGIMLKNFSLVPPRVREREICSMVRSENKPCGGGMAHNFGMEVNTSMTRVRGRVLGPPVLKLGARNGKVIKVTVDEEKCHWNLVKKSVVEGKRIDRWGVIDFSANDYKSRLNPDFFIPELIKRCISLGIHMEEPLIYECTSMNKLSRVDVLLELLESVNKESYKKGKGHLQILLCVMSRKDAGYKNLKWISETKVGIVTQCCLSTCRANDQFFANLATKMNAKLGGSNVELNDPLPNFGGKGYVMFVGADVNHPVAGDFESPSIAAVVATMNWPAANRYAARVCPQIHRKERILDFGNMCLELVQSYAKLNNRLPDHIVVFRDGVGDSQFEMVLNEELLDLKMALQKNKYYPTITLIVAQKRHQTRLFLENERDGGPTGNVSPGTVVDTTIVHPYHFDFYLCSHYGSLGTSKPTHYYVLWDEHGFTSDELQKLIYHMCFTLVRCTKPVSLVPPVYYADLVAYRGRLYYEAVVEGQSPASATSSSPSSTSSSLFSAASLDPNVFKLHADLENIMFFV
ncbi:protein argonaute 2-like [Castanea sativa]|uniref:protein argonaute 2-like n=1 Tax=Castanea sativa TaxID=21020 RepID=UPI003F6492EF